MELLNHATCQSSRRWVRASVRSGCSMWVPTRTTMQRTAIGSTLVEFDCRFPRPRATPKCADIAL